jgi:hypothetical protein
MELGTPTTSRLRRTRIWRSSQNPIYRQLMDKYWFLRRERYVENLAFVLSCVAQLGDQQHVFDDVGDGHRSGDGE